MSEEEATSEQALIAQGDASYVPFPPFATWSDLQVDSKLWEASQAALRARSGLTSIELRRAREVAKRAAAIDTGALEGLYDLDRGFTITVAAEVGYWQAAFDKTQARVRSLIESQLAAYDEVIDFATGAQPIAEAWIRALHAKLCESQDTYSVLTAAGMQEQPLPLGVYKTQPNHVLRPDRSLHAYAPVHETAAEMQRLVADLQSAEFQSAHPAIQAAFAHYAFVVIHPFADGNGRVARALASVFTYRAASIPLLVLVEHRNAYLEALEETDRGERQLLVDFVVARCVDAFTLVAESVRAAKARSPRDGKAAIQSLYRTRGGFTHADVDVAGLSLLTELQNVAQKQAEEIQDGQQIWVSVSRQNSGFPDPPTDQHRPPVSFSTEAVVVALRTAAPATASANLSFCFWVPRNAAETDEVIVRCITTGDDLRCQMRELRPSLATVVHLRLAMYVEGLFGRAIEQLLMDSEKALRQRGY